MSLTSIIYPYTENILPLHFFHPELLGVFILPVFMLVMFAMLHVDALCTNLGSGKPEETHVI